MKIRNKLAAIAAGIIAVGVLASPANASTIFNCADNQVCMFDGTNYGTYHWGRINFSSLLADSDHCINLVDVTPLGTDIGDLNNTVSSVIVNPDSSYQNTAYVVSFWPNGNCVGTPVPWHQFTDGGGFDPDLTNGGYHVSANWSNSLSSVSIHT